MSELQLKKEKSKKLLLEEGGTLAKNQNYRKVITMCSELWSEQG